MPDAAGFDIALMRASVAQAAALLRALANEDRLMVLCRLSQGESSVGELEAALGVTQPTLSQQLAVLRNEGLVSTRRAGRYVYYSIADPMALAMLGTLYQLYCADRHPRG